MITGQCLPGLEGIRAHEYRGFEPHSQLDTFQLPASSSFHGRNFSLLINFSDDMRKMNTTTAIIAAIARSAYIAASHFGLNALTFDLLREHSGWT
jgi:hypothetical protein